MRVIRSISEAQSMLFKEPTVVSIGSFDGVHLGHQQLIAKMFEKNSAAQKIIITFSPHPAKVLSARPPALIFSEKDQIEVFSKNNIDVLFFLPFTREIADLPAEKFIESILVKLFKPQRVVVGYDFSFGKGKNGNYQLLNNVLEPQGIEVQQVPPFELDGAVVSSTRIRELISQGQVEPAAKLLGRNYYLEGFVSKGRQLGRTLGFPTVNLICPNELFPQKGVYFCHTSIDGVFYKAVGNIGINPTTQNSTDLKVEFYILDFKGDLYGRTLRFDLVKRLRDEQRFSSLEELKAQIAKDVEAARTV